MSMSRYSYVVEDLENGEHRFRLKIVNSDGTHSFSNQLVALIYPESGLVFDVYPNPSAGDIQLVLRVEQPQLLNISLYDLLGRRVKYFDFGIVPQNDAISTLLTTSDLPAGAYTLHIQGEHVQESRQMYHVR